MIYLSERGLTRWRCTSPTSTCCCLIHLFCGWPFTPFLYVFIYLFFVFVLTDSSYHGHNEHQIWPGGLQQLAEAHIHLHSVIHRGDVASHQVCGGAEGSGNQPQQLKCPNTVLHLCGWSLPLLPYLWIFAGKTSGKERNVRWNLSKLSFTLRFMCLSVFWFILAVPCIHFCICPYPIGINIFCGRIQTFWLVPHVNTVWLLLHVWTRWASVHTRQTQKVSIYLVI